MTLKKNKIDLVILSLSLIFVIVLLVVSNIITGSVSSGKKYVVVSINGEDKFKYNLDENKLLYIGKINE